MKVSLVLCTINRTNELRRFLYSLAQQQLSELELILVDQNTDDRVTRLLQDFQFSFHPIYLKSAPGLSRARNAGLQHVTGDIVCFPDDDCWYREGFLRRLTEAFAVASNVSGFLGRAVSETGLSSAGCHDTKSDSVTRYNVLRRACSICIFLRIEVVRAVGFFDEALGVGAGTPWGASEEADYLIRGLAKGFKLQFDPSLEIGHPQVFSILNESAYLKAFSYGAGFGRVLKKNSYPWWFVSWKFFRTISGVLLTLIVMRTDWTRYHLATLRGRWKGWRSDCNIS